jgi:hypothetical protein
MADKKEFHATVDGKEVEIEMVETGGRTSGRAGERVFRKAGVFTARAAWLPLVLIAVLAITVLVGVAAVLVRALPIILPVIIVILFIKFIRDLINRY